MELSNGIDIIEIERIKKAIEKDKERFLQKVFTQEEIHYCEQRFAAKYQHYAVRFAAKEAVAKALGTGIAGGIKLTDIEVEKDSNGKPKVNLYGHAKNIAQGMGVKSFNLSLSHCNDYAVANAVCLIDSL